MSHDRVQPPLMCRCTGQYVGRTYCTLSQGGVPFQLQGFDLSRPKGLPDCESTSAAIVHRSTADESVASLHACTLHVVPSIVIIKG